MKVCYWLDFTKPQYLWLARKSVMRSRRFMPDAEIVLHTVTDFPDVDIPVDRVVRHDFDMTTQPGYRKAKAFATETGDCLFLDVDAFPQVDVSHVFSDSFDVALCLRYLTKLVEKLPFNSGVAFTRNPAFWTEVAGEPEYHKDYFDVERRFCAAAMSGKYHVKMLNGNVYNYSPEKPGEDLSSKAIVHYKGERKDWLYPKEELN